MVDAREMSKLEVNCIRGCPHGKKNCNCLPTPVTHTMEGSETNESSSRDEKCKNACPKGCKYVNILGNCFCLCLSDASEMAKEEVNCLSGKYPEGKKNCNPLPPVAPIRETNVKMCDEDSQCNKYCPKECNPDPCVCSSLSDAREMAKEEVNCMGGCPDGSKSCNCLPSPVTSEIKASCRRDNECIKYCPKGCQIVNCNFGTCFCSSLGDAREMEKEEVNRLGQKCPDGNKNCNRSPPVLPLIETTKQLIVCQKASECTKYCPKQCKSGRNCVCQCNLGNCFCDC
ncbi:unnamed protein product [Microthlaspi erraticum]|uniref:Uncharacterized protein n=1 Tax=Microthlaspi erraticum TaxID=1685480 RepID=A0A6D2KMQ0_9BRAS|nr:unnamed protein product [Microthlaspi erraticum]